MSEWKLRRTLQFERWRVDVNVSLPGSGEFSRYASATELTVEWCVLTDVHSHQLTSADSDESDDRSPRPVWRY